jgi:PAS domain-containing protein
MQEPSKTNQELHEEISALKRRISKLEQLESEHKCVEEALRVSEVNYRRLFDSSPSVIYQVDFRTGKFLYITSHYIAHNCFSV